jgi:hypothetical protein
MSAGRLFGFVNGLRFELLAERQWFYGWSDGSFEFSTSNRSIHCSNCELIVAGGVSAGIFDVWNGVLNSRQSVNTTMPQTTVVLDWMHPMGLFNCSTRTLYWTPFINISLAPETICLIDPLSIFSLRVQHHQFLWVNSNSEAILILYGA